MIVIGLTGFAGAGKSTVANYLVEQHGFTRLSFAAPLKKMLRTLDPVMGPPPKFHHYDLKFRLSDLWALAERMCKDFPELSPEQWIKDGPWGDEYRRLLQVLGTDCIRAVDGDFWVKAATKQITQQHGKYVFDDVRFPNEAEVIKDFNPMGLWTVGRNALHAGDHPSEKHAGKMGEQVWLWNTIGNYEYLHDQIDNAVELAFGVKA